MHRVNFDPFYQSIISLNFSDDIHRDLSYTSIVSYRGLNSSFYIYKKGEDFLLLIKDSSCIKSFYFYEFHLLMSYLSNKKEADYKTVVDLLLDYFITLITTGDRKEVVSNEIFYISFTEHHWMISGQIFYHVDKTSLFRFYWRDSFYYVIDTGHVYTLKDKEEYIDYLKSIPWFHLDSDVDKTFRSILDFINRRYQKGMYVLYEADSLNNIAVFLEKQLLKR